MFPKLARVVLVLAAVCLSAWNLRSAAQDAPPAAPAPLALGAVYSLDQFVPKLTTTAEAQQAFDVGCELRSPVWDEVIRIESTSRVGINFLGDTQESAILFNQSHGKPQAIKWRYEDVFPFGA